MSAHPRRSMLGALCLAVLLALPVAATAAPRLPAPSRVSVTAGDMSNTIVWRAPRGYRTFLVYRATSAEGPFERVTPQAVARTAYEDAVAVTGTYHYYVVGVRGRSVSASSAVASNERVAMRTAVGPAGGTMRAANGAVTLALPAGALSATTAITLTGPVAGAEVHGGIRTAPVFDLGPDGTALAVPATLTMRYAVPVSHFQVALTLERATDLATYDEKASRWTTVTAAADTAAGVFSGQLSHFSYWTGAVIQPHGTTPSKISYCSGVCHDLVDAPGSMSVIPSRSRTVCYNCHGNTSAVLGPAGATGPNIQAEFLDAPGQSFTATSSRHPVAEGKLNCTSCHDPHVDPGASYKNLRVYDAVTGKAIRSNATTSNVGNEYCWACHGTVKNRKVDALDPGYWARTGDRKTGFAGTGHDTKVTAPTASGIRCLGCHTDHGAANGALIATSAAGTAIAGNDKSLCLACHTASLGAYRGSTDYAANRHSTTTTSTKALGTAPGTGAKAGDCQNCHDPHGKPGLPSYLRTTGEIMCPSCHDAPGLTYPAGYGYRGPAVWDASGHGSLGNGLPRTAVVSAEGGALAAWESTSRPTPSSPGTPIPASRLGGLAAIDSSVTITKLASLTGQSDYQMYRFKPDVPVTDVSRLKAVWRGFGEDLAGYPVSLYWWNRTLNGGAGDWQQFASQQVSAKTTIETSATGAAPYIDASGYVYVMAQALNVRSTDVISGPSITSAINTGMFVTWTTRGLTDGYVDFGATTAYGNTYGSAARTQSHTVWVPYTVGGVYHYRVRGTSLDGESFSSNDTTVGVPAPVLTDVYGFYDVAANVTFSWSDPAPSRDPFTYRLSVWNDAGWSYTSGWMTSRTATMTLSQASYWWRVEARDRDGFQFVSSAVDSFFIWPASGSCPFLFVWDGQRFAFEADLNTTGKLGEKNSSGYVRPEPRDRYVLTHEPVIKDGQFEMRLVEERLETDYTDEFKVYAVDLPTGVDIVAEKGDRARPLGAPPAGLHTVTDLRPPASIVRLDTGEDVAAKTAEVDDDHLVLNEDADVGFDYKTLELDLGDAVGAPQVKVVMNAETERPTTPEGIARQRTFGATTKLEVQSLDGSWRSVPASEASLPNAMEFTRTYVFDITNAMHDTTGRVRFTFLFKTYIDQIAYDTSADQPIEVTEIPIASAVLGKHGLDNRDRASDVFDFVYGELMADSGRFFPGRYTRYGDVKPLLDATDDEFVVYGQGDEIVMRLDPPAPASEGTHRRYVAFIDGYYKSMKSAVPQVVEPLPFAGMSNYPYPGSESYPADAEHAAYQEEYNTRVVDADGNVSVAAAAGPSVVSRVFEALRDTASALESLVAEALAPQAEEPVVASEAVHRSLNTDFVALEFDLAPGGPSGTCPTCHAVHGATSWDGTKLPGLRSAPDGMTCTAGGNGACHSAPATGAAGINVYARVTAAPTDRTAHHDVLPSQQKLSGSRVACGDCHNPHSDDATSTWSDVDNRSLKGKSDFAKYFDANGRMLVMVAARHDGVAPNLTGATIDVNAVGPLSPVIRWTTNEAASTWVDYGLTAAYEMGSVGSATLGASHVATVTGLAYGSGYYYRIRSADALGNQAVGAQQYYEPQVPPAAPVPGQIATLTINGSYNGAGSVTATWAPVASTDGGPVQYLATIDGDVASSGWIPATTWTTPACLWGGSHTLRVYARDALHPLAVSPAGVRTFYVDDVDPPLEECPDLFTWDGKGFAFVTDVMNNASLGSRLPSGDYLSPRPHEETRIDPALLRPRNGAYELRLRDNNDEIEYVDRVALKVVDHPKGTQVFLDDLRYSTSGAAVAPQRVFTVRDPKPVAGASYSNVPLYRGVAVEDLDITSAVGKADKVYAPASLFDDNRYVFDLGDVRGAPEIKLLVTGWTEYPRGTEDAEFRASGARAAEQVLEVEGADGRWMRVQDPAGFIPGYTKTVVYDLTGKFPPRADRMRVRLRGLVRTRIDQVLVDTSRTEKVSVREVAPASARLAWAGVSPVKTSPAPSIDHVARRSGSVQLHRGMFTNYGDVLPLTGGADDRFVVMDTGDELALSFKAPARPSGTERTCVIVTDGYFRHATETVDPMPFRGMSGDPGAVGERPTDPAHAEYRRTWNMRLHKGEIVDATTGRVTPRTAAATRSVMRARRDARAGAAGTRALDTIVQGLLGWKQRLLGSLRAPLAGSRMRTLAGEDPPHLSANTDLLAVRVTRVDDAVTTYTASAGWESAGTTMSVPTSAAPGAAVSAATIARTASIDASYWVTSLTAEDSRYNRQVFAVDVPGAKKQATKDVYITWRGHGEPTPGYENVPVYLWNHETSGWDKIAEGGAVNDTTLTKPIEGVPSAYCLECHDGTPRTGVVLAGIVNVGAKWGPTLLTSDRHGDFAGNGRYGLWGWTSPSGGSLATGYSRGSAGVPCVTCHDPHGNSNPYHLQKTVNGNENLRIREEGSARFCKSCHVGTVRSFHEPCALQCHYGEVDHYDDITYLLPNDSSDCLECHKHGKAWGHTPGCGHEGCENDWYEYPQSF